MTVSFIHFVYEYNLKNKAKSNKKVQQNFSFMSLKDVGIYLRDGPFDYDRGIVDLHPSKRTHSVAYINQNYFDSYGC